MVLDQATWLKNTPFGIHQQFPKPIEDKRGKLYPVLKDDKRQGKHAVLVQDKLFINGSQYFVDDTDEATPSGDESERRCRLYGLSASFGVVSRESR
jgi:hypothetical protein